MDKQRTGTRCSPEARIRYRGHWFDLRLTGNAFTVRGRDREAAPVLSSGAGKVCAFVGGTTRVLHLLDAAARRATPRKEPG